VEFTGHAEMYRQTRRRRLGFWTTRDVDRLVHAPVVVNGGMTRIRGPSARDQLHGHLHLHLHLHLHFRPTPPLALLHANAVSIA